MQQKNFAERVLKHLEKLSPSEVESFVKRTVRERDLTVRIFETLIEGIIVLDSKQRISLFNSSARRILNWPLSRKIMGEHILELLENGPLYDLVDSFIAAPRPIQNPEIVLKKRARKIYGINILPIETPLGASEEESGAALILHDLTQSRDAQERDAQERKIASLATLTAGVAHDIKNPLNSLSIHAQLLNRSIGDLINLQDDRQTKLVGRIRESCDAVGQEVERLRACVDEFIDAARPREPVLAVNSLNAIVRSIAEMARLELESAGIRLETYLDSDIPPVLVDDKQMQHALRNLVRNAVEAIEAARRPVDQRLIVLRTTLEDNKALLEVRDNGCGISKTDLPNVFEPYFTTKFNGSGLGLMAVGRIAREHGGQISVNSEVGKGTSFTLELPVDDRRVRLLDNQAPPEE